MLERVGEDFWLKTPNSFAEDQGGRIARGVLYIQEDFRECQKHLWTETTGFTEGETQIRNSLTRGET